MAAASAKDPPFMYHDGMKSGDPAVLHGSGPGNYEYTAIEGSGPRPQYPRLDQNSIPSSITTGGSSTFPTNDRIHSLTVGETVTAALIPAFVAIQRGEAGGPVWNTAAAMSFWQIIRHQTFDRETARTALTTWAVLLAAGFWVLYLLTGFNWTFFLWIAMYFFVNALVIIGFMIYDLIKASRRNNQYQDM